MCLEKVQAELRTAPAPIAVRMQVPIKNQSKLLPNVKMRFKSCLVSHEDMEEEHRLKHTKKFAIFASAFPSTSLSTTAPPIRSPGFPTAMCLRAKN